MGWQRRQDKQYDQESKQQEVQSLCVHKPWKKETFKKAGKV
jgi:hypothetical protein